MKSCQTDYGCAVHSRCGHREKRCTCITSIAYNELYGNTIIKNANAAVADRYTHLIDDDRSRHTSYDDVENILFWRLPV